MCHNGDTANQPTKEGQAMKINSFRDGTIRKVLTDDVMSALAAVGEKYGIEFKYDGGRYDSNTYSIKIEIVTLDGDGKPESKERMLFTTLAGLHGLDPQMLDQTFIFRGAAYRITGFNPDAWKYPVNVIRVSDSKRFKFPTKLVAEKFKEAA